MAKRGIRGSTLLILLMLLVAALHFAPQYVRSPVQIKLQLAGQEVHAADVWQEWETRYETGEQATLYSDQVLVSLQLSPRSFGTRSYTRVRVPTKWVGKLDFWTTVSVQTTADIYLGYGGNVVPVGSVTTLTRVFTHDTPDSFTVYPEFWLCGSQSVVDELKRAQVGTEETIWEVGWLRSNGVPYEAYMGRAFLNVEPLLNEMEGRHPEFRLYVKARQEWWAVLFPLQRQPSRFYDIPFEAPFSTTKPLTYTAPVTVTAGWTTIGQTAGIFITYSYVFTVTETTYTLRTTTLTVTRTTETIKTSDFIPVKPAGTADVLSQIKGWLSKYFGDYWWIALIIIVVIVLFLLKWLFGSGGEAAK